MMHVLGDTVQRWLASQGHVLLGEDVRAEAVEVRMAATGTVFLATLHFAGGPRRVAVKQLPADAIVNCPESLCRVHEAIRTRDGRLTAAMPAFLGFEAEHRLVAMEFIAGQTLRDLLWKALWLPACGEVARQRWLADAAGILAALHSISARDSGVPSESRPNNFFVAALEEGWREPRIQAHLPAEFRDPERLYRHLPAAFFDRADDQLTPRDAQAKNTLVTADGQVAYIDFDYLGGSPAVSVAHYLVSLDRIRLRHPFGWQARRVTTWKQCFVDHYAKHRPGVVDDLLFFYPWSLMKNYLHQVSYRPRSAWYLARFYGRCLRSFLEHRLAAHAPQCHVAEHGLFTAACCRGNSEAMAPE